MAAPERSKRRQAAVGMRWRSRNSLAKTLDPSSRAPGPRAEDGQALLGQPIGEPGAERILGPDHDQVDALVGGQAHQAVEVRGGDVDVARHLGRARVAGRAEHLADERRCGDLPAQRVLAPAGPDHQHLHDASSSSGADFAPSWRLDSAA